MKNEKLRNAREERGFTRKQLAKEIGVEVITVRKWEEGSRHPFPESRDLLCITLDRTAAQLGLEPDPQEVLPTQEERPQGDQNRLSMIKRVELRWISGILTQSLLQGTMIHLHLKATPNAVINPWADSVQQSNRLSQLLPSNTSIFDVYNTSDGTLLILGSPGAGKTTILLELTRELLSRASLDETHPIPVVFTLSSWAQKRQALTEWLVDELNTKYQVPHKLGKQWVTTDKILPLLDGLDEVAPSSRSACIEAINAYRKARGMVSMVICSRSDDYLTQQARLLLHTAVAIQPLTTQQMKTFLSRKGKGFQAVQAALRHDASLQEMASTPLMLNIITLTFRDTSLNEIMSVSDPEARRVLIFEQYINVVLSRGSANRYTPEQTTHWLAWLAQQMQRHNLTEFYLERMQPDWLPMAQKYHQITERIVYGLMCATISATFAWLRGGKIGTSSGVGEGLLGLLGAGPGNTIFGWMAPGLGGAIEGGGTLGVVIATVFVIVTLLAGERERFQITWGRIADSLWRGVINGLKGGLLIGGLCSLLFTVRDGLSGLSDGLSYGLFCALIIGLFSALIAGFQHEPATGKGSTPKQRAQPLHAQLTNGAILGLVSWVSFTLVNSVMVGINQGLLYGFIIGSLTTAIISLGGTNLIRAVREQIQPAEIIKWEWHKLSLAQSKIGIIVGFTFPCVFIVFSLASTLFHGLHYGLSYGLIYGLIVSCIAAIAGTLIGIINMGWSATLLDERHISRPNEGIRRSAYHALLVAAIFGPLCGGLSGLICGCIYGLASRLPGATTIGIGFAITFTIIFTVDFTLLQGGIACVQHYTLRWLLFRSNALPWNAIGFLEYACERIILRRIGGGYMFGHRLLLEYFARLASKEPEDH